jgi:hypothetical protein
MNVKKWSFIFSFKTVLGQITSQALTTGIKSTNAARTQIVYRILNEI